MKIGLDSSYARPTGSQIQQAKAAGVSLWSGYLASKSGVGIAAPWSKADFDIARQCGGTPLAFCSGNDDPVACKVLAAAWNVRLCLDVESGIRGDGPWVQAWLNLSGAGLYGGYTVHRGRAAPFHIMAGYPGSDPGRTWPADQPDPGTPKGWQWQGTHNEFGVSVDRGNYDDWFAQQGERMYTDDQINQMLNALKKDVTQAKIKLAFVAILGREPSYAELDDQTNQVMSGAVSITDMTAHLADSNPTFAAAIVKIKEQHNPGGG